MKATIGACASVAGSGKGDNFVVVVVVVVVFPGTTFRHINGDLLVRVRTVFRFVVVFNFVMI